MANDLYKRINVGERRTVKKRLKAGTYKITGSSPGTITFNRDVMAAVTQEYRRVSVPNAGGYMESSFEWEDISIDCDKVVEAPPEEPIPLPPTMWQRIKRWVGIEQAIPKARVVD